MKINQYKQPATNSQQYYAHDNKKTTTTSAKKETPAAVYEKSDREIDQGHVYNRETIQQLKQEADANYANLKKMVEDLLKQQGKSFNDLKATDIIKVDDETRAAAQAAIADDGPLSVETMSDKIVQFAKVISGDDPTKLDMLKDSITKGFKEVENMLGELPDVSLKTYDRIMEKLDDWGNEETEQ